MIITALWAENQYVGVSCGKLDQSCKELSQRTKSTTLFGTKDDSYELILVPSKMKTYEIVFFLRHRTNIGRIKIQYEGG